MDFTVFYVYENLRIECKILQNLGVFLLHLTGRT